MSGLIGRNMELPVEGHFPSLRGATRPMYKVVVASATLSRIYPARHRRSRAATRIDQERNPLVRRFRVAPFVY
jgi:hypothetical protein